MRFTGDYHLHTRASDGHASVADCVRVAKDRGLDEIVISDHSFSTFIYHVTADKLLVQRKEIDSLSDSGVKVYAGIEGNIIGERLDVPQSAVRALDVLTVGFHRFITPSKNMGEGRFLMTNGFGTARAKEKLKDKNTEAYISVLRNYPVDIVAHLGHRAPVDFARVCECARETGAYIEINAKHLDTLADWIDVAVCLGVNFIVGTDAHSAKAIGGFSAVGDFISKRNIPMDRIFGIDGRKPTFKDKREWTDGRNL